MAGETLGMRRGRTLRYDQPRIIRQETDDRISILYLVGFFRPPTDDSKMVIVHIQVSDESA
jgi:hypothetical protein